tara:strand:+ start:173 stop:691 length:519 start_codon:yes stop_codon:yes gene_type:complete
MSYINYLSDDLFEKILDIRCDDIEKEIKSLNKKLIKLKKKLIPFSLEYVGTQYIDYDDYEYNECWCIHYEDVSYCMSDYLYSNFDDDNYIVLVSKHCEYFSEEGGETYISKKMFKPTFFDILVEASKSVLKTKDYHHRFLEGLNRISNYDIYNYAGIRPNKNIRYYEFMLGS